MNNTVRTWYWLFLGIVVALAAVEWSRSRTVTSLRQDNQLLREQFGGIQAARSEIEDLENLRDHLRRSIDAFAVENESLRTENNDLRQQTDQIAELRVAL